MLFTIHIVEMVFVVCSTRFSVHKFEEKKETKKCCDDGRGEDFFLGGGGGESIKETRQKDSHVCAGQGWGGEEQCPLPLQFIMPKGAVSSKSRQAAPDMTLLFLQMLYKSQCYLWRRVCENSSEKSLRTSGQDTFRAYGIEISSLDF